MAGEGRLDHGLAIVEIPLDRHRQDIVVFDSCHLAPLEI